MITEELPGDIILLPAGPKSALSSRIIVAGEILAGFGGGLITYSHAAILSATPGYQYEATFPFTRYHKIDTSREYEVWRIGNPTIEQRRLILQWCKGHVGDLYNLIGVTTFGRLRLPGTYFCSEFASFAYAAAGIQIGDSIKSPDSIPETPGAWMVSRHEPSIA